LQYIAVSYFARSLCRISGGAHVVQTGMGYLFAEEGEEELHDDFSDSDGYLSDVRILNNSGLCGPAS
jgi:hypothetical protein